MSGNTFSTLKLDDEKLAGASFDKFVSTIKEIVGEIRRDRDEYYRGLREKKAAWANRSRFWLSLGAAVALILTAIAAALRFAPKDVSGQLSGMDGWFLFSALVIYGLMSAFALFERGTDKTSAYFRHLSISLGIRDLWNKFQLSIAKEYSGLKAAADQDASRRRILEILEAFCTDLDKLVAGELTDWRNEFLASLSELEAVAKSGAQEVREELTKLKEEAKQAAKEASDAAARAEAASKPGHLNVVVSGDFEGEVVMLVDGVERARTHARQFAVERISAGIHKVSISSTLSGKPIEISSMLEVQPGVQSFNAKLS